MRILVFALAFLFVLPSHASTASYRVVDGTEFPGLSYRSNYIKNPEFNKTSKTGITDASTITSIAGSLFGASSLRINAGSAAQIVKINAYAIDSKIQGLNCMASFYSIGGTGFKAYVLNGSTKVSTDLTLSTGGVATKYVIYFPCDQSAIAYDLTIESTATAAMYIDSAYLGEADVLSLGNSINLVDTGAITITATTTTPTATTVTRNDEAFSRDGSRGHYHIEYVATAGNTNGSGAYLFPLNSPGCAIDSSVTFYIGTSNVGATNVLNGHGEAHSGSNAVTGPIVAHDSTHVKILAENIAGAAIGYVGSSTIPLGAAATYNLDFDVPCASATSLSAISQQQEASMWSGYLDNTCSWARTNAAYGDPATDASCALVTRQTSNFGTVTISGGASTLPGVVFTPQLTGIYYICATAKIAGATLGATLDAKLWDGTTVIAENQVTQAVATDVAPMTLCGLLQMTAGASKTIGIQTRATSGAVTIAAGSTNASAIEWAIAAMSYSQPTPYLVNTLINNYGGVSVFDTARVTVSNTVAAFVSQSGAWTIANGAGAGLTTVTFVPAYSSEPHCSCTIIGAASTSASWCGFTAISASSIAITRTRAGAAENGDVEIECRGNK